MNRVLLIFFIICSASSFAEEKIELSKMKMEVKEKELRLKETGKKIDNKIKVLKMLQEKIKRKINQSDEATAIHKQIKELNTRLNDLYQANPEYMKNIEAQKELRNSLGKPLNDYIRAKSLFLKQGGTKEMLGEDDIPEAIKAKNGVLM